MSSGMYYEGFSWAVPTCFKDALAKCRFEEGDTFYDNRKAYNVGWTDAKREMHYSIQARFPKKLDAALNSTDSTGIFGRNWSSDLILVITDYHTGNTRQVNTFQGALYTLLWKGRIEVLDSLRENLPLPPTISDLNAALNNITLDHIANILPQTKDSVCFLTPYCPTHEISCSKRRTIGKALQEIENVTCFEVFPHELGLDNSSFPPTFRICIYSAATRKVEKMKDTLKEVLYKPSKSARDQFRLRNHGLFLNSKPPQENGVIVHGFHHLKGLFYRYRLETDRSKILPASVQGFLFDLLDDCPNSEFFNPPHCSDLCNNLRLDITLNEDDPYGIKKAIQSLPKERSVKSLHEHIQKFLIDTDEGTIACEVPLWLEQAECPEFLNLKPNQVLTGHIDFLSWHKQKLWIWDFKPGAAFETSAAHQVYLYALMLSKRAALPLENIRCGYFDECHTFWFEPDQVRPLL